ncbi:MAG: TIM barrel protein [Candidatus Hecatellaceae archaeon]
MKIRLGPAGIPTVATKRSTVEGIKTVAQLGLNAMEVEFVRGVAMSLEGAAEAGQVASQLDVRLSVHAPYFINLCSKDRKVAEASKKRIVDSLLRAERMGALEVVVHAGYYGGLSSEEAYKLVKQRYGELMDEARDKGVKKANVAFETTGKVSQFGTLDELISLCREVNCLICVDFAHIYARQAGKIDYAEVFDRLKPLKPSHLHVHFSGIEWSPAKTGEGGNEKNHVEIKHDKPPFKPLAQEILKRKIDVTIISESPILEQDSLVMKRVFEELGYKF